MVFSSPPPQSRAGSKQYMAPEVIKMIPYTNKVDIWSTGCVLQEIIEGKPPYREYSLLRSMFRTATIGEQGLRGFHSDDFNGFCYHCFRFAPEERWSAETLLKHPYILKAASSKLNHGVETYMQRRQSSSSSSSDS